MNNRKIAVFIMTALLVAGCGTKSNESTSPTMKDHLLPKNEPTVEPTPMMEPDVDPTVLYADVLDPCYEVLAWGPEWMPESEGFTGIMEYALYGEKGMDGVGYTFMHLSENSVPELVIAKIDEVPEIFAIYSWVDEQPSLIQSGWGRNRVTLLDGDREILCRGSSGVMDTSWLLVKVVEDGSYTLPFDELYTKEKPDEPGVIGYYRSTGEPLEEKELSDEEFEEALKELESRQCSYELTPFTQYIYTGGQSVQEPEFEVMEINEEDLPGLRPYGAYSIDDEGQPKTMVLFHSFSPCSHFCVIALNDVEVKENGELTADVEVLYRDEGKEEESFVMTLGGLETIPQYGFSFMDQNSRIRFYALSMSGEDGRVFAQEVFEKE